MVLYAFPIIYILIIAIGGLLGILAGVVTFFVSKEGVIAILVLLVGFVLILSVPLLPNRYAWVRAIKRKIKFMLNEEK